MTNQWLPHIEDKPSERPFLFLAVETPAYPWTMFGVLLWRSDGVEATVPGSADDESLILNLPHPDPEPVRRSIIHAATDLQIPLYDAGSICDYHALAGTWPEPDEFGTAPRVALGWPSAVSR